MAIKRLDLSKNEELNMKVYTLCSILVGVMEELFKN